MYTSTTIYHIAFEIVGISLYVWYRKETMNGSLLLGRSTSHSVTQTFNSPDIRRSTSVSITFIVEMSLLAASVLLSSRLFRFDRLSTASWSLTSMSMWIGPSVLSKDDQLVGNSTPFSRKYCSMRRFSIAGSSIAWSGEAIFSCFTFQGKTLSA